MWGVICARIIRLLAMQLTLAKRLQEIAQPDQIIISQEYI